ncbi:MAG: hypothetical protein RQ714_08075, partial [Nitrosomonas sp.]|nr:hypothetical protein [Nitrosomonas sp.]
RLHRFLLPCHTPEMIIALPSVSCIVTCYSEGDAVKRTVHSLLEQSYPGHIEIMAMVDGVQKNRQTYNALMACIPQAKRYANRSLVIVPKIHWSSFPRFSVADGFLQ